MIFLAGLITGILLSSVCWLLLVGLCLSSRERDEREAREWAAVADSVFEVGDHIEIRGEPFEVTGLSAPPEPPPWINGTDAA